MIEREEKQIEDQNAYLESSDSSIWLEMGLLQRVMEAKSEHLDCGQILKSLGH